MWPLGGRSRYASRASGYAEIGKLALMSVAAVAVAGGVYWSWSATRAQSFQDAVDDTTGCLVNRAAPHAKLVIIDVTDPLGVNAPRVRQQIMNAAGRLPRYGRLIILPVADDLAEPLVPVFNMCWPGAPIDGDLTVGTDYLAEEQNKFFSELDDAIDVEWPEVPTSPIPDQIIRAASDAEMLRWIGAKRSLLLITDGLESSFYSDRPSLSRSARGQLPEVDVTFFEIGNARDIARQTPAMRQSWIDWVEDDQGGYLTMVAPGYAASK